MLIDPKIRLTWLSLLSFEDLGNSESVQKKLLIPAILDQILDQMYLLAQMMILFQSRGPWYLKTNFPVSGRGEEESELQCGELVPNFKV